MTAFNKSKLIPGLLCFLSFLLFYGLTSRADILGSDDVAVFASGISLETQGNLAIDNLQWLANTLNINLGETGRDGHLYAKYFPGNILSTSIVYHFAKKPNDQPFFWSVPRNLSPTMGNVELAPSNSGARLALKINALFGALAMTALFLMLNRYFDRRVILVTVFLTGICSDWWYQSRGLSSEVGAGAFLITCLYFSTAEQPYQSGIALGLSLLFRPTNIITFPVWGKVVWDKGRKAIWSGIGIAAGLLVLAWFNWIRFGSVFNFGYASESFTSNIILGLAGILFSPGRSLFIYSPILILAILGAQLFYKKEKALTLICLWTVLSYIFIIASWHNWDGGWSWGSRLLTPIVPVIGFLTAPAIEYSWGKKRDILVVIILAFLGLGIQLIVLAKDPLISLVNSVVYGSINYNETIFTLNHSWLALQINSLQYWKICDLDAYTLRQWLGYCPPKAY
jgi:hypothetical protein